MLDVLLLVYDVNNQFHNLFQLQVFVNDHFHHVIPLNEYYKKPNTRRSMFPYSKLFILIFLLNSNNRRNDITILNRKYFIHLKTFNIENLLTSSFGNGPELTSIFTELLA